MSRFVLDDLQANRGLVDQHWRPQSLSCPFCLLNFTVHARLEDLDQESFYFLAKTKLLTRVDYKMRLNKNNHEERTESRFWCQVEEDLISMLGKPWAYLDDFQMFNYRVEDYIDMHACYEMYQK